MGDRILIVDDDLQLDSFLERYFSKNGLEVVCAATAKDMKDILSRQTIDLCVLDLILPDRDGLEILKEIRRTSRLPIVVLSARDEVFDKVVGLELGADDYVTKPFEPRELLARVKSVLRRSRDKELTDHAEAELDNQIRFGDWELTASARTLVNLKTGKDAGLTNTEFEILRTLIERKGVVLSREQILNNVRGSSRYVSDRSVDIHIMRLRRKIEPDPSNPVFIRTVAGIGYCFQSRLEP